MPGQPLLSTKYAQPPLPNRTIDRPGLYAELAEDRPLTVVTGPAGYGKTTLVNGWLVATRRPAAWLTLETVDSDPAVFLAYLAASIGAACPELDPRLIADARFDGSSLAPLVPLINAVGAHRAPLALVLDDYHQVGHPLVHEMVAFLVGHAPPNLRTVLVSRADPPLPLARLRARGALTEIRAGDLRFTPGDAHRFLTGAMELDISETSSERLAGRTEGWIAGLQLAALSLRGRGDVDAFVAAFGSSDRYIFDYLTDEALARQPAEVRAFLEATCVLERLSGSLCDALTGRTDGSTTLEALAAANLFVQPLDERRAWYRYHPLFADLVASNLDPARSEALHRAAAAWFEPRDLAQDAIRHHLAAGDVGAAATLIETVADLALARGEFSTVVGWCEAVGADAVDGHPGLGLVRAWARFLQGDLAGAEACLPSLEGYARTVSGTTSARLACLRAWFANRHDQPDAEPLARAAIAGIPEADPIFRSLAFTTLGEALVGRDAAAAVTAFNEAHRLAAVAGRSALVTGTVYSLAITNLVLGRRSEAEARCRAAIAELGESGSATPPWIGMLHLPLGVARYEAGDYDGALQHIVLGQELCDRAGLRVTMLGAAEWQEVLILHERGRTADAWRRLEAVRREGDRHHIPRIGVAMGLLATELLLREADPAGARARLEQAGDVPEHVLGGVRDRVREIRARVLLAVDRPADALAMLEPLERFQRDGGRHGRLIGTLALTAVGRDRSGDRRGGFTALAEAVELAAPDDIRRPFLDPVVPLDALLARVRHVAPGFVDALLARGRGTARPGPATGDDPDAPFEPLSARELEVLRLVSAGLSNDEIGRELFVTSGTAKWHVHNVLAKLGCRNRVGLAARARSLRLV